MLTPASCRRIWREAEKDLKVCKILSNYGTDDRISAAVRISALKSDVTSKKPFILFPRKRMELVPIFCQAYNVSDML